MTAMTDSFRTLRILTNPSTNEYAAIEWEWVFSKGTEESSNIGITFIEAAQLPEEHRVPSELVTDEVINQWVIEQGFETEQEFLFFLTDNEKRLDNLNYINSLEEYYVHAEYVYPDL